MAVKLKIHDRRFRRLLKTSIADGLNRAGRFYRDQCRRAVNRPNTGGQPSRPATPPRKVTGTGRDNIVFEEDRRVPAVRVGVTPKAMHLIRLELGTRHVRPRPWLIPTLIAHRQTIGRLAASGEATDATAPRVSP